MDFNLLKEVKHQVIQSDNIIEDNNKYANDIAIIGLNAQVGSAKDVDEFWQDICEGRDLIRDFPPERWNDAEWMNYKITNKTRLYEPVQGAYLDRIDQFDSEFFNIAPVEAQYMDPVQRMFLESAWSAFEDAGYCKKQLNGSDTGVFVGYSNNQSLYNIAMDEADEYTYGVAVSGNVNSIIASRISYWLNLRGPAMMVDTACSSGLSAVHTACAEMKEGRISLALVGGIRMYLIPPQTNDEKKIGIESSVGRCKTFDNNADGTGRGEGVVSIILKPLSKAIEDQNNIYAVIKGSSMNQDGASVGITAPNAEAQEAVIVDAWKNADIDPTTISYIEAHGTATALGDPVEIAGIERAFRHYTNHQQFCAVGSVKTNVGHLDCAAGMAGLLKAILMLKYKKIPPSNYFKEPNRKIDFINSPVYVNDKLTDWNSTNGVRRCGVSSFGISGTNCHMILEEAPSIDSQCDINNEYNVLTVSGRNKESVIKLIQQYQKYLVEHPEVRFEDFCYTANVCRDQYRCRFAVVIKSRSEFINADYQLLSTDSKNYYYNEFWGTDNLNSGISSNYDEEVRSIISKINLKQGSICDNLTELISFYLKGVDIPWMKIGSERKARILSIPGTVYNHKRCWLETKKTEEKSVRSTKTIDYIHIDECVLDTYKMKVFSTQFTFESSWELKEHRIKGVHVLPGTVFIDIAHWIALQLWHSDLFEMQDLVYLVPFTAKGDETIVLHTIVEIEDNALNISFCSKNVKDGDWICNTTMKVVHKCEQKVYNIDVDQIVERCEDIDLFNDLRKLTLVDVEGKHWDNVTKLYKNENEVLIAFQLQDEFEDELDSFYLFPSMLDPALNGGSYLVNNMYLPFSMTKGRFYERMPKCFYSYIQKNTIENADSAFAGFNILLLDETGKVIGEVEDYIIKRVYNTELFNKNIRIHRDLYSQIKWIESTKAGNSVEESKDGMVLLISDASFENTDLFSKLQASFHERFCWIEISDAENKVSDYHYQVRAYLKDIENVLGELDVEQIKYVIQVGENKTDKAVNKDLSVLRTAFYMVQALLNSNVKQDINVIYLTRCGVEVSSTEEDIIPINNALSSFGSCVGDEYANFKTHAIDFDNSTDSQMILHEIMGDEDTYRVAYRNGKKYIEQIEIMEYSNEVDEKQFELKNNGVYIIAGGMGGMGLALSQFLLSINSSIHIVLLNRNYSKADLLDHADTILDGSMKKKVEILQNFWNAEMDVDVIKTDISDFDCMQRTLNGIRQNVGKIYGIVNAAGVPGNGFIMNKDWNDFESGVRAKIIGTMILHELTSTDSLDFFVMCSSYATIFGAAGQSDYIAANAFMDSFTYYRRKHGNPSTTINWTGWGESGMAVDMNVDQDNSYLQFINNADGDYAFEYSIKMDAPRVLVGKFKLNNIALHAADIKRKIRFSPQIETNLTTATVSNNADIKDVVIIGKSMNEITEVEEKIINAWVKTLGVDEVDINSKFFEVGGNSLLASYLHKEINTLYPGLMTITDIFVYSSVAEIADYISTKLNGNVSKAKIEAVEEDISVDIDIEKMVSQFVNGDIDIDQLKTLL